MDCFDTLYVVGVDDVDAVAVVAVAGARARSTVVVFAILVVDEPVMKWVIVRMVAYNMLGTMEVVVYLKVDVVSYYFDMAMDVYFEWTEQWRENSAQHYSLPQLAAPLMVHLRWVLCTSPNTCVLAINT